MRLKAALNPKAIFYALDNNVVMQTAIENANILIHFGSVFSADERFKYYIS